MKKVIWKYELAVTDLQTISMPPGAEILCVQTQNNKPCIWAMVQPMEGVPPQQRTFQTVGTGHPMLEVHELKTGARLREYIGTYQLDKGILIFHLFEVK